MPDINMQVFEEAKRNQLVTEVNIQTQVALDDYQVPLSNIANPTQSQDNVVIDRFGEFLPHWNESLDFDTWVKVSMEIAGKQILILRGNPDLSSVSSGDDTFIQWHGAATAQFVDSLVVSTNIVYEGKVKRTGTANILWGLSRAVPNNDDYIRIQTNTSNNLRYVYAGNEDANTVLSEVPQFPDNTYVRLLITCDGTTVYGYVDGNEISSGGINTNLPNENLGLFMWEPTGSGEQEWSFARKYTATEPTWLVDGEQNIAVALKSLGRVG